MIDTARPCVRVNHALHSMQSGYHLPIPCIFHGRRTVVGVRPVFVRSLQKGCRTQDQAGTVAVLIMCSPYLKAVLGLISALYAYYSIHHPLLFVCSHVLCASHQVKFLGDDWTFNFIKIVLFL